MMVVFGEGVERLVQDGVAKVGEKDASGGVRGEGGLGKVKVPMGLPWWR
jgi:hypothetical protein